MMRPRQLHDNIDGFNAVVDDTLQSILRARGKGTTEGDVTTLEHELPTWATECKLSTIFPTSYLLIYHASLFWHSTPYTQVH